MTYRIENRALACLRIALLFAALSGVVLSGIGFASPSQVYHVRLNGTVDPLMVTFVKRVAADVDQPDTVVVFEIDTFGGRVDSAFEIVDALVGIVRAKTIAYVAPKAISAGALLALACRQIVMQQNSTIGDCAPITYSNEGPQMMGEKFQSPIRAKFRALAKRNNYPEALAEAMVSLDKEVLRIDTNGAVRYMDTRDYAELTDTEKAAVTSKKIVVKKGELLTMDDVEARELGFSQMSVATFDELRERLDLALPSVVLLEKDGVETFFGYVTMIGPLLMLIGLGAIYTEIKTPGFGAPGAIGILCISLFLMGQSIVGLADYADLLLVVLGFVLVGLEVFVIPGFGIAGISGAICIATGLILSLQGFVLPDPQLPWEGELFFRNLTWVSGAIVLGFVLSMMTVRFVIPRLSRVVAGPYLESTLAESHADSSEALQVRVGDAGTALSALRPAGKMQLDDRILDVISAGEFIAKGAAIRVSKISGNRVIVTQVEAS